MNELQTLHDAWREPAPPSPAACRQARTALLARAGRRRRPARVAWTAALAAAAIAALGVAENLGTKRSTPVLPHVESASARVLHRAAAAAAAQRFTAPRGDQWIYTEARITSSAGGDPFIRAAWHRADGNGAALRDNGGALTMIDVPRPRVERKRAPLFDSYAAVAKLPADPAALLRWAREQTPNVEGAGSTDDAEMFNLLRGLLEQGVLPPELRAALYRAIAQVPGVTVERVTVLDRQTLAVGQVDDFLRQQILLDPESYEYRGQRSTVVHDATVSPEKAGNATGEIKRGHWVIVERLAAGVVDRAGERP